MPLHPLEKIAKKHFGVTDNLEETGYVLSDGTFLDLSGRHQASGYERRGDRFVPKKRQPDYLANQRSIDHRQLPSEIFEAVGTEEGSAAMFAFLRETGALRLMPGAGFLVARMPTFDSVEKVVQRWRHTFGDEPLYVDVIMEEGEPRVSQEFEDPRVEEVEEFLESQFGGASLGASARGQRAIEIAEVGAFKRPSREDKIRRTAALIAVTEVDPDFTGHAKKFDAINLVDGRDFLAEDDTYDMVVVHSVLSPGVKVPKEMKLHPELMVSDTHDVEAWRDRLVATGAKYIVVCEGQPHTMSGYELGRLPGYELVKADQWVAVYQKT
jgi:hypothetical protein